MNRVSILLCLFLAFSTIVCASPSPPLPWVTSTFSVQLDSGAVDFRMDCPAGKLTRLSATRGGQVANIPMDRLASLSFVGRCSGVSTSASLETEGSSKVSEIELKVKFSQEYFIEELQITFDPHRFEFTEAMWLLTFPEESTQIKRLQLR